MRTLSLFLQSARYLVALITEHPPMPPSLARADVFPVSLASNQRAVMDLPPYETSIKVNNNTFIFVLD